MFDTIFDTCMLYVFVSAAIAIVTFVKSNSGKKGNENDFSCSLTRINYVFAPSIFFVKTLETLLNPEFLKYI